MASTEERSVLVTYRHPDEPVQNLDMFARAWDECIELQVTPKGEWIGRALLSLQELGRYEIGVRQGTTVIGGLVLADDPWDVHVGPCMSVFAQYVLPEYRLQGVSVMLMRAALSVSRDAGAPVLAFTHRAGPWVYRTVYHKLQNKVNNETT